MEQMFFPVTRREAERTGIKYSSEANKNALFPSRLRELRAKKSVSQEALSKVLGVSKSTIGLWENGDTLPDAKAIHDLAKYFEVSTEYILCLTHIKSADVGLKSVCEYIGLSENAVKFLQYIGYGSDESERDIMPLVLSLLLERYEFFQVLSGLSMSCKLAARYYESSDIASMKRFENEHLEELQQLGLSVWDASASSDMFIAQANSRFLDCMEKVRSYFISKQKEEQPRA